MKDIHIAAIFVQIISGIVAVISAAPTIEHHGSAPVILLLGVVGTANVVLGLCASTEI